MINWDEFEHIHVIRKIREILERWWNTEVFFADDRGNIRGIDREKVKEFKNLVCNLILQTDRGFDLLADYAKNAVEEMKNSEKSQSEQRRDWVNARQKKVPRPDDKRLTTISRPPANIFRPSDYNEANK